MKRRPSPVTILLSAVLVCAASGLRASAQVVETQRGDLCYLMAHAVGGFESFLPPTEPSYSDVTPDHCAYAEIEYAISLGLMMGYVDGLFRPESTIARAQAAVFIARAIDLTDGDLDTYTPPVTPTFSDVPYDYWAYEYIEYIAAKGVTTGYPDGSFGPTALIDLFDAADWVATATGTYVDPSTNPCPPDPPAADFVAAPLAGDVPLLVSFTDLSANEPVSWSWDFGDTGSSTLQNPTHEYASEGGYTVSLTVRSRGGSDTETKVDYVWADLSVPSAAFSAEPQTGVAPLTVDFTDLSIGHVTARSWDFGDGTTSTAQNPSHEYTSPGIFAVSLTVTNAAGSDTAIEGDCITVTFPDADPDHWACAEILACVQADIVGGYEDGTYQPGWPVTRDQMAVYIARALAGGKDNVPPGPATATFNDVPVGYWAYDAVEYCYDQSVVQGYDPTTYGPTDPVTRDQMAVYVARALVAPTGDAVIDDYVPSDPRNFPDVDSGSWAYNHIEYCVEHGVVQGYDDGYYHPEYVVTRDQMAVYIARAFNLL